MLSFLLRAILLPLCLAQVSCSQGEFHNKRDSFQSIYGLTLQPLNLVGKVFVGRVVDANGQPMPYSKIFLKGSPLYTSSNHKGGFYLTGLQEGPNTLFIIAGNGLGRTLDVPWNDEPWIANENITLEKVHRVSGRVSSGAAPVSEARVLVDGSPFSALTDAKGQFVLELPGGSYRIKAQHLLYNPFESTEQVIDGDKIQNINLEPLGFPTVELSLDRADGPIVRGLKTQINIKMSAGVRYMRVIHHSGNVSAGDVTSSRWVDVQSKIVLEHQKPGSSFLSFQFMDQFGKMTDPVHLNYYNTLLDRSWSILYGHVTEPLTIKKHDKVAFVNFFPYANSWPAKGTYPEAPTSDPASSTSDAPFSSVYIDAPVEIQAGATIRGAAQFNRALNLIGAADAPINWDLRDEAGQPTTTILHGPGGSWQQVALNGGSMLFYDGSWDLQNVQGTEVSFLLQNPGGPHASLLSFHACKLVHSHVELSSLMASPEPAKSEGGSSQSFRNQSRLVLKNSLLEASDIKIDLINQENPDDAIAFVLQGNNFFGAPVEPYYLSLPPLDSDQKPILNMSVNQNHFEDKERIIKNLTNWVPYLGLIVDGPLDKQGALSLRQNH